MAIIDGCNFPEDLYYDVENQMWVVFEDEETIRSGLTDVGQFIAGSLLYVKPREAGKVVEKGKRVAIIESGKYVGPIRAPLSGQITQINEEVTQNARLVNEDPYGKGWIFKLKPTRLEEERASLLIGNEAIVAVEEKMKREGWNCKESKGVQA